MNVLFTLKSANAKLGPIPMAISEGTTCPDACPLKGEGCYARFSYTGILWNKVNEGKIGGTWGEFIARLKAVKPGSLWRYAVAGDLPGKGNRISGKMLSELVEANTGKRGFTYTHKPMTAPNRAKVRQANEGGFVINLSADTMGEADELHALKIAPVVTLLPKDQDRWPKKTPNGVPIVPCLAVTKKGRNCLSCGWCANRNREFIVGFPAHGTKWRSTEACFEQSD